MTKKRDRLEVIYDILNSVRNKSNKIKPTHLLYKSNLSYSMMKNYLDDLMGAGLMEEGESKTGKYYFLTEKGFQYLAEYVKIKEFTESFGL
jgi:predicted transcriptional regulator